MSRARGFTLIEMMIGLALMAILIGLALPSFSDMLRNWSVRGAAETLSAGLQLARAEAIKRNGDVSFALISSDPLAIKTNNAAPTYSASGPHWAVFAREGTTFTLIDSRPSTSNAATYTSSTPSSVNAGEIIFDAMGRARQLTSNYVFEVKGSTGTSCQTATAKTGVRCLNTVVTPAGSVRMCDPAVGSTDSRACP